MLNPKKTIPKLAVAMLALTGCSGDGDGGGGGGTGGMGTGGSGGDGGNGGAGGVASDFDASLSAFCMNVAPCFNETVQSCTSYYMAVNDYNANPQCEARLITYFDCGAANTCDQLLVQGVCDDEYYAAWDVCEEVP